jgi:hypothetical protein
MKPSYESSGGGNHLDSTGKVKVKLPLRLIKYHAMEKNPVLN